MVEKHIVPEELRVSYKRMLNLAPDELCDDPNFQQAILLYLKIGGEKLARQHIKVATQPFCAEFTIKQRPAEEIVDEEDENKDENKEGDEERDDDGGEESETEIPDVPKED